jgi:hypothetical protein
VLGVARDADPKTIKKALCVLAIYSDSFLCDFSFSMNDVFITFILVFVSVLCPFFDICLLTQVGLLPSELLTENIST